MKTNVKYQMSDYICSGKKTAAENENLPQSWVEI